MCGYSHFSVKNLLLYVSFFRSLLVVSFVLTGSCVGLL